MRTKMVGDVTLVTDTGLTQPYNENDFHLHEEAVRFEP